MILNDKVVVVTGGTGSLGKVMVRRILSGELGCPKKLIIFSRDEGKQHAMRQSYLHKHVTTDEVIYRNIVNTLEFRIGDVRSYAYIAVYYETLILWSMLLHNNTCFKISTVTPPGTKNKSNELFNCTGRSKICQNKR